MVTAEGIFAGVLQAVPHPHIFLTLSGMDTPCAKAKKFFLTSRKMWEWEENANRHDALMLSACCFGCFAAWWGQGRFFWVPFGGADISKLLSSLGTSHPVPPAAFPAGKPETGHKKPLSPQSKGPAFVTGSPCTKLTLFSPQHSGLCLKKTQKTFRAFIFFPSALFISKIKIPGCGRKEYLHLFVSGHVECICFLGCKFIVPALNGSPCAKSCRQIGISWHRFCWNSTLRAGI